jgi:hypothetical protein
MIYAQLTFAIFLGMPPSELKDTEVANNAVGQTEADTESERAWHS